MIDRVVWEIGLLRGLSMGPRGLSRLRRRQIGNVESYDTTMGFYYCRLRSYATETVQCCILLLWYLCVCDSNCPRMRILTFAIQFLKLSLLRSQHFPHLICFPPQSRLFLSQFPPPRVTARALPWPTIRRRQLISMWLRVWM